MTGINNIPGGKEVKSKKLIVIVVIKINKLSALTKVEPTKVEPL